jgi:hypothetical protein
MREYLSDNANQVLDGLFFGLGMLAVYLGAVFSAALVRSLGGAGSSGLQILTRYMRGWWEYLRDDNSNTVNVTLNAVADNHLSFDTLVADRRLWFVWPNAYRVHLIRRAAKRTTIDDPVLHFPTRLQPRSLWTRLGHACGDVVDRLVASEKVVENGKRLRVRLRREDDYRAIYSPLISLVAEKSTNDHSLDLALGYPMDEYRFVIALTNEKLNDRRSRHLRAMVMAEDALVNLPEEYPQVETEEHKNRYRTLLAIASQYREHPEWFGIVRIWRRKSDRPARTPDAELLRVATAAE